MKPEDFPLVIFEGRRLRRVPEPPSNQRNTIRGDCCTTCVAMHNNGLCGRIQQDVPNACIATSLGDESQYRADGSAIGCVFVPEENFQEYVVELVRRRVSS